MDYNMLLDKIIKKDTIPALNKKTSLLSYQQESIWYAMENSDNEIAYNIAFKLCFDQEINYELFEEAVNCTLSQNQILRSTFSIEDGVVIQRDNLDFTIKLNVICANDKEVEIQKYVNEKFDVKKGNPLFKVQVFEESEKIDIVFVIHHLICDGWSLQNLVEQIKNNYNGNKVDKNSIEYTDYVNFQRKQNNGKEGSQVLKYWKNILDDYPETIDLPYEINKIKKNESKKILFKVDKVFIENINYITKTNKITNFMFFLTVYYIVLYRYTGQNDLVIATPVANRNKPELRDLQGFISNTLLLRVELSKDNDFVEAANEVKKRLLDSLDYQDFSMSELIRLLNPRRIEGITPFFQVFFSYQNKGERFFDFLGSIAEYKSVSVNKVKADLNLVIQENSEDAFTGYVEYDSSKFSHSVMASFVDSYKVLMSEIIKNNSKEISKIKMVSSKKQLELAKQHVCINKQHQMGNSIVSKFEELVKISPNNIAISYNDDKVTYLELSRQSNSIANQLLEKKVHKNKLIGVYMNRSPELISVILSILKMGCAYVPLDPMQPVERINYIVKDAGIEVIISEKILQKQLVFDNVSVICVEDIEKTVEFPPTVKIELETLAYVIYTSGSTGNPKGVKVSHNNVLRLFSSTQEQFNFKSKDKWTLFHSYAFDFSVWEIFGALLNGGELVIVPYEISRTPRLFYSLLIDKKITVLNISPSAFKLIRFVDEEEKGILSLSYIICGAEALDIYNLKSWYENHDDQFPQIVNMYGITEITVHGTIKFLKKEDSYTLSKSNIGIPISDMSIYILDQNLQLVPDGVVGEMYIAGEGISEGYLNKKELTSEKFIDNPFALGKMYKSGDLARRNKNGELEYIGREDDQIKIRGFRVEIGEVESQIGMMDTIKNVVVISKYNEKNGAFLIAYIVRKERVTTFNESTFKKELRKKLPEYMIPTSIIELDSIPMTGNGKVDKKSLPDQNFQMNHIIQKPRNSVELRLLDIWIDIFGHENISITDDFFEIGGHSIMAVMLMDTIRKIFNKEYMISYLLTNSTIERLATGILENNSEPEKAIIQIRKSEHSEEEKKLFIVHPGMGQILCYQTLAKYIEKNISFYGFQPKSLYSEVPPINDVSKIANDYIQEMKIIQPQGPYYIAGYCVGGTIAHEIVSILEKSQDSVEELFIIDIKPPKNQGELSEGSIVNFFLAQLLNSYNLVANETKNNISLISDEKLNQMEYAEIIDYILIVAQKLQVISVDFPIENMIKWYETWKSIILAMNTFTSPTIKQKITNIVAKDGYYNGYEWSEKSISGVDVKFVNGNHYSMLEEPNVLEIAEIINTKINKK